MASNRYRSKLCRNFALGYCPQGDRCKYLHSTTIPSSQAYSTASAMHHPIVRGHPTMDARYGYVPQVAANTMMWSPPLPSIQGINISGGHNWNVQQTYPTMTAPPNSSSQLPHFRPLSWRTTLCRHFVKNQGWCPLGDECGYIHDLNLAAYARDDIRFPGGLRPPTNNEAGSKAGTKHSHCWAYVQGLCRVKDCPYLHPIAVNLFVPHTPCLAWPNCPRGPLCNFKHPEPLIPRVPAMPPVVPPLQVQPPTPINVIPSGTVQFHGTTYFPVGMPPQGPARSPAAVPSTQFPWNYSPLVRLPSLSSGQSPYSNESQPFHSPFYEAVSTLPPPGGVPRAFADASLDDEHSPAGVSVSHLPAIPEPAGRDKRAGGAGPPAQGEEDAGPYGDFPYRAPEGQRAGHAKRLSVALKSKEDSDVARGPAAVQGSLRRESWMGHRARDDPAHRSWPRAPDFLTQPRPLNLHSFQLMP